MKYLKKNQKWIGLILFLCLAYNLYFVFLLRDTHIQKLLYLDMLAALLVVIVTGLDAYGYYTKEKEKSTLLQADYVICREFGPLENMEVAEHDVDVLEEQLREQFDLNCGLQDYIAKWCHEVKLPLAASLLMNEKIQDAALRTSQKEQLERIRQQLNGALLGCKVHSRLFDLKVRAVDLLECVRASIHNNQYFLIQNQFEIQIHVEPVQVYTDGAWFVYVLDQLVQNAMKYARENPVLKIWSVQDKDKVRLAVEDHGEGIAQSDIRRIFERGYTGSNHHNGRYKSTGMGLYMVSQILGRLGHEIAVESEYGAYTRFQISILGTVKE